MAIVAWSAGQILPIHLGDSGANGATVWVPLAEVAPFELEFVPAKMEVVRKFEAVSISFRTSD